MQMRIAHLHMCGYTLFMASDSDRIKEQLSIVEVVAPYVKLEKAGRNFKGKSPFNSERTPSFFVSPEKNLFHDFSSQKGGDIFTFIQEVEGLDFQGALKFLADKAGITLSQTNTKDTSERTQLYEVMELATKLYEISFRKDADAVNYMLERGLTKDIMKEFRIGYAPQGWQYLYEGLKAKGFSDQIIEKAGLGIQGKKGLYDRFRERIMFPIADSQGRVVAFTGRIFVKEGSDTNVTATGKYVNSPETPVYSKSNILYAYDKARRAMMKENKCIIVEGQMDVVMSHQSGVLHTVAISGTALTAEQVKLIKRFTDVIVLSLDADRAGVDATKRSVDIAYEHDMSVSIVFVEGGKDPADLVKENPDFWYKALEKAMPYIDYRLKTLHDKGLSVKEKSTIVKEDIFSSIDRMKGSIMQDEALQKVSHFLGVAHEATRNDFIQWQHDQGQGFQNYRQQEVRSAQASVKKNGGTTDIMAFEHELLALLIWQESDEKSTIFVEEYKGKYRDIVGETWFNQVWGKAQNTKNSLIFEAELRYDGVSQDKLLEEIEQLLAVAILKKLEKRQRNITQELRRLEKAGNDEASHDLLREYQDIAKKIEEVTQARLSA
jgi:DNA primase